jgi:hypothetical protein
MAHSDWLPTRELELADLAKRWDTWISNSTKRTAFAWPVTECSELVLKIGDFLEARDNFMESDTSENLIAKKNTRIIMEEGMRKFATNYIRNNDKMKDEDKFFMGVRVADKNPTPYPVPVTWPESIFDTNTPRQIGITCEDSETRRKALPHGVHWIEHTWKVLKPGEAAPEPLPNINTFDQFETWTKPNEPCILRFNEDQRRGSILHTSRWVNSRSEPGPWGLTLQVTIP